MSDFGSLLAAVIGSVAVVGACWFASIAGISVWLLIKGWNEGTQGLVNALEKFPESQEYAAQESKAANWSVSELRYGLAMNVARSLGITAVCVVLAVVFLGAT